MGIEEEIDNQLKIMEEKIKREKINKICIGNNKEYVPCQKIIENYEGDKKDEFQERL